MLDGVVNIERLERLRVASRSVEGQGQAARTRPLDVSRMDRRAAHRDGRHPRRRRRHRHRVLGHDGDGPGAGDELHATRCPKCWRSRSNASASSRATPTSPTAWAAWVRARRSSAARRWFPRAARWSTRASRSPPTRSKPRRRTSSTSAGRFAVAGTDRAIGLAELAAKQPEKLILRFSATENRRRAVLAQRRPGDRGRDRSGDRRDRRSTRSPASTTSAASSTA